MMRRRTLLGASALAALGLAGAAWAQDLPPLAQADRYTVGFEKMEDVVREYTPEHVADICGIRREHLEQAAHWIGTTPQMVSTELQGFY